MGMVPPLVLGITGVWLALTVERWPLVRIAGWGLAAVCFAMLLRLGWHSVRPRLGYEKGNLLVYLTPGRPVAVPIEFVECFFLGETAMTLPGERKERRTSTLVVRLAESAKDWKHREVKPSLGSWSDAYITIHGTWCEPLSVERVHRLNQRLAEIHRQRRASAAEVSSQKTEM